MDHPIAIITFQPCRVGHSSSSCLWAHPLEGGGSQHTPSPPSPCPAPSPCAPPEPFPMSCLLLRIFYRPLSTPVCYGEGWGGCSRNWGGGAFLSSLLMGKGTPCASSISPPKLLPAAWPRCMRVPPHPGVPEPGLDPRVLPGAGLGGAVGAPPPAPTPNPKASSPGDLALRCPTEPCRGWGRDLQLPWASPPGMLCPHIDASPPSVCLHGLKHLFGAGGGGKGAQHSLP